METRLLSGAEAKEFQVGVDPRLADRLQQTYTLMPELSRLRMPFSERGAFYARQLERRAQVPLMHKELKEYLEGFHCTSPAQINLKAALITYLNQRDVEQWGPRARSWFFNQQEIVRRQQIEYLMSCLHWAREKQLDEGILFGFDKRKHPIGVNLILEILIAEKSHSSQLEVLLNEFVKEPAKPVKKTESKNEKIDNKRKPAQACYELYWKYLDAAYYDKKSSTPDNLLKASQALVSAKILGSREADNHLKIKRKLLLPHQGNQALNNEYQARLQEVKADNSYYHLAQEKLFSLNYFRKYTNVYTDYKIRFKEIELALKSLQIHCQSTQDSMDPDLEETAKQLLLGYPDTLSEENLRKSVIRYFLVELKNQNHFRVMPKAQVSEMLAQIIPEQSEAAQKALFQFDKPRLVPSNLGTYSLQIVIGDARYPIVYVNQEGLEIARIAYVNGHIKVYGYGNNLNLTIASKEKISALIIENEGGNILLAPDFDVVDDLVIGAEANQLQLSGKINSQKKINIESSGQLIIDKNCEIGAGEDLIVVADHYELQGKTHSANNTQMQITHAVAMGPESECSGKNDIHITARAITELRGHIQSDKKTTLEIEDGVYFHGAAKIEANDIEINAKKLMSTDKAEVVAQNQLAVKISEGLVLDKTTKLKAKRALVRAEDSTVINPKAVIETTDSLELRGGSVWNGGKINSGKLLQIKLNKVFVHGVSEAANISESFGQASLNADNINIVAGAICTIGGIIETGRLTSSAIAELNIGLTKSMNISRSNILALDMGIDVPNPEQLIKSFQQFWALCANKDYDGFYKMFVSWESATNGATFARFLLRTATPGAGKAVDALWSLIMLIRNFDQFSEQCQKLYNQKEKIEACDIYALLSQMGNMASQGITLDTLCQSLDAAKVAEMKEDKETPASTPETPSLTSEIPALALNLLSLFLPGVSNQSVFEARIGGIHAAANLMDRTGFSFDLLCTQIAANVTNSFIAANQQKDVVIAANVAQMGHDLTESNSTLAMNVFTNVANQVSSGNTNAQVVNWQATETLEHKGVLHASNAVLQAGLLTTTKESVTHAETITLSSEKSNTLAGHFSGKTLTAASKEAMTETKDFHATVSKATLHSAGKGEFAGKISVVNPEEKIEGAAVSIDAEGLTTTESSEIDAQNKTVVINSTSAVHLSGQVEANKLIENSKTDTVIAESFKATVGAAAFAAEQKMTSNGTVVVKHDDSLDPKLAAVSFSGDTTTLGAQSHIDAGAGDTVLVSSTHDQEIGGSVNSHTVIAASTEGNIKVSDEAKVDTSAISLTAKNTVDLGGHLKINHDQSLAEKDTIYVKADKFNQEATSSIDASEEKMYVDAEHGGTIAGSTTAHTVIVKAHGDLVLANSAHIDAKITDIGSTTGVTVHASFAVKELSQAEKDKIAEDNAAEEKSTDDEETKKEKERPTAALNIHAPKLDIGTDAKIEGSDTDNRLVLLKSNEGTLKGEVHVGVASIQFDNLSNQQVQDLAQSSGEYSGVHAAELLDIQTKEALDFSIAMEFDHSVSMSGSQVTVNAALHSTKSLALKATEEDLIANQDIHAEGELSLAAKGSLINNGREISGHTTFIESEAKDVENLGGTLKGESYLEVSASKGKVQNVDAISETISYDSVIPDLLSKEKQDPNNPKKYITKTAHAAHILGGTGDGYDGVGLRVKSGEQTINKGSEINSEGDGLIQAQGGFENENETYSYEKSGGAHFENDPYHRNVLGVYLVKNPDVTETKTEMASVSAKGIMEVETRDNIHINATSVKGREVFLHSTEGNVALVSASVSGENYVQIVADKGDVALQTTQKAVGGMYGPMQEYTPSQVSSGAGTGHDVALYIKAGNKFQDDGSNIHSVGSNYIESEQDMDYAARSNSYVSYHDTKEGKLPWSKDVEKTDTAVQVQSPSVVSDTGKNTFISNHGHVNSVAGNFTAPGKTYIYGETGVIFNGLVTTGTHEENSNWNEMFHEKDKDAKDSAVPTTIISPSGDITVETLADIKISNAYIATSGQLKLHAKNVIVTQPILHSHTETTSYELGVQGPSLPQMNIVPVQEDVRGLSQSKNATETAANAWNLGVDGLNTGNALIAGLRTNSIGEALFQMSSTNLGSVSLTRTNVVTDWQSTPTNTGIKVGYLEIKAEDKVSFENAVNVSVAGDADIQARRFSQRGAALESYQSTERESLNAGVSVTGHLNVGAGLSGSYSESTTVENQVFAVGGRLTVNTDDWTLQNANTYASSLSGYVHRVSLLSETSTSRGNSWNIQANTNGNFSYNQSHYHSAILLTATGIQTVNGDFRADSTDLTGASIAASGTNTMDLGQVQNNSVEQYNRSYSLGFSANAYDIQNQLGPRQWNEAIPTVGVQVGRTDWEATTNAVGTQVTRDESYDVTVKVPLYNPGGLRKMADNLDWAKNRIQQEADFNDMPELVDAEIDDAPKPAEPAEKKHAQDMSDAQVVDDGDDNDGDEVFNADQIIDEETEREKSASQHRAANEKLALTAADAKFVEEEEKALQALGGELSQSTDNSQDRFRMFYNGTVANESEKSRSERWNTSINPTRRKSINAILSDNLGFGRENNPDLHVVAHGLEAKVLYNSKTNQLYIYDPENGLRYMDDSLKTIHSVITLSNGVILFGKDIWNTKGEILNSLMRTLNDHLEPANMMHGLLGDNKAPFDGAKKFLTEAKESVESFREGAETGDYTEAGRTTGKILLMLGTRGVGVEGGAIAVEAEVGAAEAEVAVGVAKEASVAEKSGLDVKESKNDGFDNSDGVDRSQWGTYRVSRGLPRVPKGHKGDGDPVPDVDRPHSQIGEEFSSKGYPYTQAREWGYNEKGKLVPTRDIDFTDHTRSENHANPHQHRYVPNETGGTLKRSKVAESVPEPTETLKYDSQSLKPKI